MLNYAQEQINSYLGWEDLEVVNPESDAAHKGETGKDQGLNQEARKEAWGTKQFQQYIGMDVTSLLSVPVWIMEPTTVLQKAAEIMEYTDLLDLADKEEDPYRRMALVVAFLVSPYGANERAWKPFNPILGETFELDVNNDVRYFAEQVSHHPPVAAAHAENEHFEYDLVSAPSTKFLGNSLEVYPLGRTRIRLKKPDELYAHVPADVKVNNIVLGRTWLDVAGDFYVWNTTTKASCVLSFTPCGWFSYGRYEFAGYVTDAEGTKRAKLSGKWNSHCDLVMCDPQGEPLPDCEVERLWTCAPKPGGDYYGFTHFAVKLNECKGIRVPLPSDSRRRSDRAALQLGNMGTAQSEKYRLEEMQRAERRERESQGDTWRPKWFELVEDAEVFEGELGKDKVPFWRWTGRYFKEERTPFCSDAEDILGAAFSPWQYPQIHEAAET